MAKLNLSLDTETKEITVDIDGNAIANVSDISIANWGSDMEPYYSFNVTTCEKVGGVSKITRLVANESAQAKQAIAEGKAKPSPLLKGYVEISGKTAAQEQFVEMWKRARKI